MSIVFLVLASATLHPIWNLLVKKNADPQLGFLLLMAVAAACSLIHGLIAGVDFSTVFTVLPVVALSVCGQLIYGTCLTATLTRGDLSTYYPIIRASPVFVVAASILLFGKSYSLLTLFGISLVVAGSFLLLYRRGSHYLDDPVTLLYALLALCGTGIYSLADAHVMQHIAPQVLAFTVDSAVLPFFLILWLRKRSITRLQSDATFSFSPIYVLLPGVLCYLSYYLILVAYQLGGDVAVVTSLRQASIPISVALGGMFLREGAMTRRFVAASLLALGIVVISVYG
ncbi:MAG: DMT family transporter [Roseibium album]|uniref:Phosphonate utilization associated putative membrane protein n=1 Tax=Roseibium album TaxID=311410 RepID=A0A0M7AG56_9HYPH|nr:DMT family transporter [Roseibium album]MBG6145414.1 drug/metabolite transporter (DMT)-like permease [Labrenzia sp. EL_142]MBG6166848.1 drug/metabolite transporter (DMT)-like permease [Labrenzia sp. EL_195]MBG6173649.1 drug/metabolite transporter (DMT)-like permease [Labrenzia sp. EL_132]MBG6211894.1 drug/metabolite transporter (DMT)-like permease [Labrenzia sp. EL_126]MBG6228895.1 drug/metabolite transporter (DMT)-like permease [Labrenzia sp. EL_208]MCR9060379.1 DMT family transporter [Pa